MNGKKESAVKPLLRYSKPYADVWKIKADFYEKNDAFVQEMNRIAAIYRHQPQRKHCMICGAKRSKEALSFQSHGIEYFLCPVCGHLNGTHELTSSFSKKVYEDGDYGSVYRERESQEAYDNRMRTIYLPKAQFMVDALRRTESDHAIYRMKYLDVGAGSGYYVRAMQHLGLRATGMEISASQVNWGGTTCRKGRFGKLRKMMSAFVFVKPKRKSCHLLAFSNISRICRT